MNETITIIGGIEATVLATVLFTVKTLILFFAIMQSVILLRNAARLAGLEASGRPWTWLNSATIVPTLLWTIFWILCQLPG